jgi:hypothetical protein
MVFVLIPAALSASLSALRRPGTLGNMLFFRVGVFAASATFAAVTFDSQSTVTALQPAAPSAPIKKQLIRRRSSLLEPGNEHALVRATPAAPRSCEARAPAIPRAPAFSSLLSPCASTARVPPLLPLVRAEDPPLAPQQAAAWRRGLLGLRGGQVHKVLLDVLILAVDAVPFFYSHIVAAPRLSTQSTDQIRPCLGITLRISLYQHYCDTHLNK